MAINRRLSGGRKLRYHKLFGSMENPPLGFISEQRGVGFTLDDYEAAVQALIRQGSKPAEAQREVGRKHGHLAWPHLYGSGFTCNVVYLPKSSPQPHAPMAKEANYRHRDEPFIAGWWYDRHLGMGPTSTYGAWVATRVGYLSQGPAHRGLHNDARYDEPPKHRYGEAYYLDEPHCVGVNPYHDFRYIGEYARPGDPKLFPCERAADVEAEIIFEFIKLYNGAK